MAVIRPQIETDPTALEQIAYDYLESAGLGWERADGDLMSWLIGAHARMVAEERDIAADVPIEQILRPLGEKVHRVEQQRAVPATARAKFTMRDTAGYTIPAGLEVLVKTSGDEGVTMLVVAPHTIEPNLDPPEGVVDLRAAPGREGADANGLRPTGTTVVPIRSFEFIRRIELASESANGRDAESDEDYLQRLVDTLALATPAPVLLDDFAAIARQQDNVARALAVNHQLWRPEVIEIAVGVGRGSVYDGAGRAITVAHARTSTQIETDFAAYGARATGGPLGTAPVVVTLNGRARYGPWKAEAAASSTVAVSVRQHGGERNPVERAVAVAVITAAGDPLSREERAAVQASIEGLREVNWLCSVIDPIYTEIDVDFRAIAWPSYDPRAVLDDAVIALRQFLSPARWGIGEDRADGTGTTWVNEPNVRYLEVAQVLNEVPGLRYVTSLGIARANGTPGTSDVALDGLVPLPRPGPRILGEVTEA
ncbi:baseplate J/gp47 family protein [Conexibacter woesei]|uniref:Uncharacterized protein n=1 Tax=Conexibacter woesei (strain DSM 14684 / CCUG 47730 / CIP 108061 / JCM 11494 / NBRC 100937 / ID131577) TaxID=469383 RepID=D3F1Z9_CONWI|nr:baseplate J/gp47 family protein [Conexibacter woesei]ADB50174.1 hypothetical protein Cwoe_1747 [Conexibacter woesei DSM 14684]